MTTESALFVSFCGGPGKWRAGRVTVRSRPNGKLPDGKFPPSVELYDNVDKTFFRTCWVG